MSSPDNAKSTEDSKPKQFDDVLQEELNSVEMRRHLVHEKYPINLPVNPGTPKEQALQKDMVGLAVSGGGIRSGTFTLGLLQALASLKLLNRLDYFSSVSGGGYVAGWFAAWVRRETVDPATSIDKSTPLENVEKQLNPSRREQGKANRFDHESKPMVQKVLEPDAAPVEHLRAFSRYLAPSLGVFNLDSWTLAAIYLRNLFVNWLIFIPLFASIVLLARFLTRTFTYASALPLTQWFDLFMFVGCIMTALVWFRAKLAWRVLEFRDASARQERPKPETRGERFDILAITWLLIVGSLFGLWIAGADPSTLNSSQWDHSGNTSRLPDEIRKLLNSEPDDPKVPVSTVFGTHFHGVVECYKLDSVKTHLATVLGTLFGGAVDPHRVSEIIPDFEKLLQVKPSAGKTFWNYVFTGLVFAIIAMASILLSFFVMQTRYWNRNRKSTIKIVWKLFGIVTLASGFLAILALLATCPSIPIVWKLGGSGILILSLVVWMGCSFSQIRKSKPEAHPMPSFEWPSYVKRFGFSFVYGFVFGLFVTFWINNLSYPDDLLDNLSTQGNAASKPGIPSNPIQPPVDSLPKQESKSGIQPGEAKPQQNTASNRTTNPAALVTLGPPTFLFLVSILGWLEIVSLGNKISESEREIRSRLLGMFKLHGVFWLLICGTVLFVPNWLEGDELVILGGTATTTGLGLVVVRQLLPLLQKGITSRWSRNTIAFISSLFLVSILVVLAILVNAVPEMKLPIDYHCVGAKPGGESMPDWVKKFDLTRLVPSFVGLVAMVSFFAFSVWRVNVNTYSLHTLYGNRLSRAYLGASSRKNNRSADDNVQREERERARYPYGVPSGVKEPVRYPDPFTGFAEEDDFSLAYLRTLPERTDIAEPYRGNYYGPLPIFNTTINLVSGSELGYQDRKGASFVLTPLYCGSEITGYAKLKDNPEDLKEPHLTVGRAMTISGAAVDANMGILQSSAFTAVLTLLNLRLGWWIENPSCKSHDWIGRSPNKALLLIDEIGGLTTATDDFVHLSDGGHFENLGVYELIRRRCRFIIASECAEDPNGASENLAILIRNVRRDFGIQIDIDTTPLQPNAEGRSPAHVAIGTIHYDDVDANGLIGTLVFVRGTLTGDESADILNFAKGDPDFPHHTTLYQFFDEPMFESYRELGFHIGRAVFGEASLALTEWKATKSGCDLRSRYQIGNRVLFSELRRQWSPAFTGIEQAYVRSGEQCLELQKNLRKDNRLNSLIHSLYPELAPVKKTLGESPPDANLNEDSLSVVEMLGVSDFLAVMELTWLDLRLDRYHSLPINRGWMNAFRRWSSSDKFKSVWPILRGEYSKGFVQFCERTLNLGPLPVQWSHCTKDDRNLPQLDKEFFSEWGGWLTQSPYNYPLEFAKHYLTNAVASSEKRAWLITLGQLGEKSGDQDTILWDQHHPMGIAIIFRHSDAFKRQKSSSDVQRVNPILKEDFYELLVWIRGSFRTLELGRRSLRGILETGAWDGMKLVARYPKLGSALSDRVLRTQWTLFLNDFDFRRPENEADFVRDVHNCEVVLVRDKTNLGK